MHEPELTSSPPAVQAILGTSRIPHPVPSETID